MCINWCFHDTFFCENNTVKSWVKLRAVKLQWLEWTEWNFRKVHTVCEHRECASSQSCDKLFMAEFIVAAFKHRVDWIYIHWEHCSELFLYICFDKVFCQCHVLPSRWYIKLVRIETDNSVSLCLCNVYSTKKSFVFRLVFNKGNFKLIKMLINFNNAISHTFNYV